MSEIHPSRSSEIGKVFTEESLIDGFEKWLKAKNVSPNTLYAYKLRLGKWLAWLGEKPFYQVKASDLVQWRDELAVGYSAQTVALHLTVVRRFYKFLVEGNVMDYSPVTDVEGPARKKVKQHKRDTITRNEWLSLLSTTDGNTAQDVRDRLILLLAYELGFRQVEITRANLGDLRTRGEHRVIWVQSKGDQSPEDEMFLPESVEAALHDWIKIRGDGKPGDPLITSLSKRSMGKRLSVSAIRVIWLTRKEQAGITGQGKTFHSLRHTAIDSRARYAVKHGKSSFLVQSFARHADPNTTAIYIHNIEKEQDPPEYWGTHANGNGNGEL